MQHFQPELELALLHIRQVEQRVAEQEVRIARLRAVGAPTELAEDLLRTLLASQVLLKAFVARTTGPVAADKASS